MLNIGMNHESSPCQLLGDHVIAGDIEQQQGHTLEYSILTWHTLEYSVLTHELIIWFVSCCSSNN